MVGILDIPNPLGDFSSTPEGRTVVKESNCEPSVEYLNPENSWAAVLYPTSSDSSYNFIIQGLVKAAFLIGCGVEISVDCKRRSAR